MHLISLRLELEYKNSRGAPGIIAKGFINGKKPKILYVSSTVLMLENGDIKTTPLGLTPFSARSTANFAATPVPRL